MQEQKIDFFKILDQNTPLKKLDSMFVYRGKSIFAKTQKQELIEQNHCHFWIQRAQITLNQKFLFVSQCNIISSLKIKQNFFFQRPDFCHNLNDDSTF